MNLSYNIPESKRDITIERYKAINEIEERAIEEERVLTDNEKLSMYLNIPLKYVSKLDSLDYDLALSNINTIEDKDTEVIHRLTFDLKGVRYGFIPDLQNITIGERAAIETLLKDGVKNACELMNVFYRPIVKEKLYNRLFSKEKIKRYLIEEYNSENDCSHFLQAPSDLIDSSVLFFYSLGNDLIASTLSYSKEELEKQVIKVEGSGKSGDGIKHLIHTLQQSDQNGRRTQRTSA